MNTSIPVLPVVVVPHESHPHACTWIAYGPPTKRIWGSSSLYLIEQVKENLRTIAITIAGRCHETVHVLVRPHDYEQTILEFETHIAQHQPPLQLMPPSSSTTSSAPPTKRNRISTLQNDIVFIPCPIDDIWIRDTGPIFVLHSQDNDNDGEKQTTPNDATTSTFTTTTKAFPCLGAVNGNFNGWGNKQTHSNDAKVADFITNYIRSSSSLQRPTVVSTTSSIAPLCVEGGSIEVDEHGTTAICIESCIINDNRNPGYSKEQCTTLLCQLFGFRKIIWLPGNDSRSRQNQYDITDGHVDGYIRFVPTTSTIATNNSNDTKNGSNDSISTPRVSVVVMAYDDDDDCRNDNSMQQQQQRMQILQHSTTAQNETIQIVTVPNPTAPSLRKVYRQHPDFCASYVNYYICNDNTVLVPQFNIEPYDTNAIQILTTTFPKSYTILPIPIHTGIACGGGGIHCVTLQQPFVCSD